MQIVINVFKNKHGLIYQRMFFADIILACGRYLLAKILRAITFVFHQRLMYYLYSHLQVDYNCVSYRGRALIAGLSLFMLKTMQLVKNEKNIKMADKSRLAFLD